MFAVVVLKYMEEMSEMVWIDEPLLKKSRQLREEIDEGVKRHGVVEHGTYGKVYAYEVDGLGNFLLEDDANVPSLLSIPYFGYDRKYLPIRNALSCPMATPGSTPAATTAWSTPASGHHTHTSLMPVSGPWP